MKVSDLNSKSYYFHPKLLSALIISQVNRKIGGVLLGFRSISLIYVKSYSKTSQKFIDFTLMYDLTKFLPKGCYEFFVLNIH